jgi:selenium-binding protein 1
MAQRQNPANSSSFRQSQFRWKTDPTFYPTARLAMESPAERYAYVAALAPSNKSHSDALLVVDVDASSGSYGKVVGQLDLPNSGDELHHFGWNACSTALCPYAPHPHLERRYLVVPGLRSSRIHIVDTKPDPTKLEIVKIIEPEEVFARTGYSRPHTVHCGRKEFTLALWARQTAAARVGFPLDTSILTCWDVGRWIADRRIGL